MGSMLVDSESPRKADIVLVLAGDTSGHRAAKGAELVRAGYAPKLFLSNGLRFYGLSESDAAANYVVGLGVPREQVVCLHESPQSTQAEARMDLRVLREMGVHSMLLVTSPSHTARATRIFRRLAPDMEIHPVAAEDPLWCGGFWWTERECRKTWFMEEVKTVTRPFGI